MTTKLLPLVALLLPLVAAAPTGETLGTLFSGVASQDSLDRSADWYPESRVCTESLTTLVLTLVVREGTEGDALALRAGLDGSAVATPGHPAALVATNPSGCPEFEVRGASVATLAPYAIAARLLPFASLP